MTPGLRLPEPGHTHTHTHTHTHRRHTHRYTHTHRGTHRKDIHTGIHAEEHTEKTHTGIHIHTEEHTHTHTLRRACSVCCPVCSEQQGHRDGRERSPRLPCGRKGWKGDAIRQSRDRQRPRSPQSRLRQRPQRGVEKPAGSARLSLGSRPSRAPTGFSGTSGHWLCSC